MDDDQLLTDTSCVKQSSDFKLQELTFSFSSILIAGFPLAWKVRELVWSGKVREFC